MGLEWRHKERDVNLPANRQLLMKNIEQDLLNDEHILTVFYGGSIGKGNIRSLF